MLRDHLSFLFGRKKSLPPKPSIRRPHSFKPLLEELEPRVVLSTAGTPPVDPANYTSPYATISDFPKVVTPGEQIEFHVTINPAGVDSGWVYPGNAPVLGVTYLQKGSIEINGMPAFEFEPASEVWGALGTTPLNQRPTNGPPAPWVTFPGWDEGEIYLESAPNAQGYVQALTGTLTITATVDPYAPTDQVHLGADPVEQPFDLANWGATPQGFGNSIAEGPWAFLWGGTGGSLEPNVTSPPPYLPWATEVPFQVTQDLLLVKLAKSYEANQDALDPNNLNLSKLGAQLGIANSEIQQVTVDNNRLAFERGSLNGAANFGLFFLEGAYGTEQVIGGTVFGPGSEDPTLYQTKWGQQAMQGVPTTQIVTGEFGNQEVNLLVAYNPGLGLSIAGARTAYDAGTGNTEGAGEDVTTMALFGLTAELVNVPGTAPVENVVTQDGSWGEGPNTGTPFSAQGNVVVANGSIGPADVQQQVGNLVSQYGPQQQITVLVGTHGSPGSGAIGGANSFPEAFNWVSRNVAAQGWSNVQVVDVTSLSPQELLTYLNQPGPVLCAWCNSAITISTLYETGVQPWQWNTSAAGGSQ